MVEVTVDPDTGAAVQTNPLNYTVGAWESYPKLTRSDDRRCARRDVERR